MRQAQQELADSLKKLSMSEASLEVNTRYRNDLEEEKARLFKDMDRLKRKVLGLFLWFFFMSSHVNDLETITSSCKLNKMRYSLLPGLKKAQFLFD